MIITALIGYPTAHSVSPTLFSIYAKEFNLEYSHLKIDVQSRNLKKALEAIKVLGLAGLNITLPHKIDVIKYLDFVDKEALEIGAVNTVVNKKGLLYGYNTDSYGAMTAIKNHTSQLLSKKVLVLGSGGAARAVITGLLLNKSSVTAVIRSPKSERTQSIIKQFGKRANFIDYGNVKLTNILSKSDIVCNTTFCGMTPKTNESPLRRDILKKASLSSNFSSKLFFDVIFSPYNTQFLNEAKKLGAQTQGGTEMMIYQGVRAFELWTGKKVSNSSIEKAKQVLKKRLLNRNEG